MQKERCFREDVFESFCQKTYDEIYKESIENPEDFWSKIAEGISWSKKWEKILDDTEPVARCINTICGNLGFHACSPCAYNTAPFLKIYGLDRYPGGELNACYNAVDRHVEDGRGEETALVYDSPVTGVTKRITFKELLDDVSRLSGVLKTYGVSKGDTVAIYMPVIPETVVAMLASCRIGAIHSVFFGGLGEGELSTRIDHIQPKIIITASCGLEPNKIVRYKDILDTALTLCNYKPTKTIIFQREIFTSKINPNTDIDWFEALKNATSENCVPVESNHPLYILHTSGTTGTPKGVERPTAGHIATLTWTMRVLYGMKKGDVWWAASDFGWVVGHSYMCYAPLLAGITAVIHEGKPVKTPDAMQYFRMIETHKINALFAVPTALRCIKRELPRDALNFWDLSSLRYVFVAGEFCDLSTVEWTEKFFGVPVINHWWQTETGHAISTSCVGLKDSLRHKQPKLSSGKAVPGFNIRILRPDGTVASKGELGRITVKHPLPPGTISTLYKAPKLFLDIYFSKYKGYYDTMDAGFIDNEGYIYVTSRDDEVIKVAGHRISTSSIENAVLSHPEVADAAVVPVSDELKGDIPLCLFVSEVDVTNDLVEIVRRNVGPIAALRHVVKVKSLPKTKSGKTCRKLLADLANDRTFNVNTFDDLNAYEDIVKALQSINFALKAPKITQH